jgi:hypothetical protein
VGWSWRTSRLVEQEPWHMIEVSDEERVPGDGEQISDQNTSV